MVRTELLAAARAARRAPLIPVLVMLLAATGLGFALAMWSLLDALYLRPLPLVSADRIVTIIERHPERGRMAVTPANFLDWSRSVHAFSAVSGSFWIDVNVSGADGAVRVKTAKVLPRFSDVWTVAPLAGRAILDADFEGDGRVAVVSERLWRSRMAADRGAVGSMLRIDGVPYTVVGVMPAAASAIGQFEIWIPWIMTADERANRQFHLVGAIGRLRDNLTAAEASAELEAEYGRLASEHPDTTRDWRAAAVPLRDSLLELSGAATASLSAIVVLTFAVACLNVGALVSAWWSGRRQELVTRMAVGGSRLQVMRGLLIETALWAMVGLAGAIPVAMACLRIVSAIVSGPDSLFDFAPRLDLRAATAGVILFAAFVGIAAAGPAFRSVVFASRLVTDTRSSRRRGSRAALAGQIALALVVGTVAIALSRNVSALTELTRPDSADRQALEIVLPETRYVTEASQRDFFTRLLSVIRSRAEVRTVSASSYVPPTAALGNLRFTIEGRTTVSDAQSASPAAVDAAAFRALGIPLLHGRMFDDRDGPGAPDVCILSQALAHRYWGSDDPIGARLHIAGLANPVTVIGIAGDVRQPISTDPRAEAVLYLPYLQAPWPFMTLLVEPTRDAAAALGAVREELGRLDNAIASGPPRPLADLQVAWTRSPRLHAQAIGLFGGASLLLTLAGLYARMVLGVIRRRREWAVRQAVGATPGRLWRSVGSEVGSVTAIGLALGLLSLPLVSAAGRNLVYGADLLDWPRALAVAAAIGGAALLAGTSPARHATRVNLATLLRDE
jgi:putative ABC transport system permease protein